MRVFAALTFISTIAATVRAFAPNRSVNNARSTATALSAGLFDNMFKDKEQVGTVEKTIVITNTSVKKQLDGMMKKKKYSVLIISSSAKDCIKEKQLFDQKSVKYTAVELVKESNAEAIRAEFGVGIWIREKFIAGFNELNTLDKKGELDGMLKNVPKTTYKTPV